MDTSANPVGTAETPRVDPTAPDERIRILDVLRGFALLGILITNIQHFSMFAGAVRNPTLYGDFQGANFWVYALTFNLAFQKFMPVFAMLFGAGIMLAAERREEAGTNPTAFHYRRMGILLLIALAHGYLIWYGDILFSYAVCGALVFAFRRRTSGFLIGAGIVLLAGGAVMEMVSFRAPDLFAWVNPFRGMSLEEVLATDLAAFRGGWTENLRLRVLYTLEGQTTGFLLHEVWRSGGLILLGMGLYRLGVMTGRANPSVYRRLLGIGVGIALPLTAGVFWLAHSRGWNGFWLRQLYLQVIYWVGIPLSLGWLSMVVLACRRGCQGPLGRALAAVGRTALSNYLLQSLLCTSIFYGYGLGLYGSVERTGQMAIVLGVWVLQLLVSSLWLRHFRFGPAEWVWRSLSYGRPQPFRVAAE
jgi:uncharacterized protein